MKQPTKPRTKLSLHRNTLQVLTDSDLQDAAGGLSTGCGTYVCPKPPIRK